MYTCMFRKMNKFKMKYKQPNNASCYHSNRIFHYSEGTPNLFNVTSSLTQGNKFGKFNENRISKVIIARKTKLLTTISPRKPLLLLFTRFYILYYFILFFNEPLFVCLFKFLFTAKKLQRIGISLNFFLQRKTKTKQQ